MAVVVCVCIIKSDVMVMFLVEGKHQLRVDVEVGGALSDGRETVTEVIGL